MIKARFMSAVLSVLGFSMIGMAFIVQEDFSFDIKNYKKENNAIDMINVVNMSSSNRDSDVKVVAMNLSSVNEASNVQPLSMEQVPQSVYIPPRVEVYEGMTLEELGAKLDRSLGNSYIGGKGSLIASKCIELGVDPYIATAIILHETGCNYSCSSLVVNCNNVGGQKGAPSCGNGSYKYYVTIDDGIVGHIENLYRNYFLPGRNTVESIAPKYAASSTWSSKINWYIEKIRAS